MVGNSRIGWSGGGSGTGVLIKLPFTIISDKQKIKTSVTRSIQNAEKIILGRVRNAIADLSNPPDRLSVCVLCKERKRKRKKRVHKQEQEQKHICKIDSINISQ